MKQAKIRIFRDTCCRFYKRQVKQYNRNKENQVICHQTSASQYRNLELKTLSHLKKESWIGQFFWYTINNKKFSNKLLLGNNIIHNFIRNIW